MVSPPAIVASAAQVVGLTLLATKRTVPSQRRMHAARMLAAGGGGLVISRFVISSEQLIHFKIVCAVLQRELDGLLKICEKRATHRQFFAGFAVESLNSTANPAKNCRW